MKNTDFAKYELNENPLVSLKEWLELAIEKASLAGAGSLATINEEATDIRTVLVKDVTEEGPIFFTNYNSRKSEQINRNPNVSLSFYWADLKRQLRINGQAKKIPLSSSEEYFYSRAKESQVASYISAQSKEVASRQKIEEAFESTLTEYQDKVVPCENWGGYIVEPSEVEFFFYRDHRLNDRFFYKKIATNWSVKRLWP